MSYFSAYQNLPWLEKNTLFLTKHGSHAYGLNTPTSDLDVKGFAVPPKEYYLGFVNRFEQAESHNEKFDIVIYEIQKFFKLAADCNPSIIEVLWTAPEDHLVVHPVMERIFAARDLFLSKRARWSFSGYAIAQLKRIRTHRSWLLNPPKKKPERVDFSLPEHSLLSPDIRGILENLGDELVGNEFPSHVVQVFHNERAYHNAVSHFKQYENWKNTRNPLRAANEQQFGYDTKHAMHLVRLMTMAEEILTGKGVVVKRPDRDFLLSIRNGAWTYDELMVYVDAHGDEYMNDLYEKSTIPHSPHRKALDTLCISVIESIL